jgi:hypothetical protein
MRQGLDGRYLIAAERFGLNILDLVAMLFIGLLVCCLRSLNGMSQRGLFFIHSLHRVATVEFLTYILVDILILRHSVNEQK